MSPWTVFPAIDLREGQVVRLVRGDPNQQTTYSQDPLTTAVHWRDAGATWLHVVDLDAALDHASKANRAALTALLTAGPSVQFGGGLRTLVSIRHVLDLGVRRAVLGTAAIENPAIVSQAIAAFGPERIAVGLDLRGTKLQTHGWTRSIEQPALSLARHWAQQGLHWLIYTDTERDGTGAGINWEVATDIARATQMRIIASGGVASLEDVRQAHRAGLAGIIIGRALYTRQIDLQAAIAITNNQEA